MKASRCSALVAASALALGCGAGSITVDQYEAGLASATCSALNGCGPVASFLLSDCVAKWQPALAVPIDAALADRRVRFDGQQAKACIDALATAPCAFPRACDEVLQGNVAPGGACRTNYDCAAGTCDSLDQVCPSTCRASAEGAACPCDARLGLTCVGNTCAKLQPRGAACAATEQCQDGLACHGTCQPPIGLPCNDGFECPPHDYCYRGPDTSRVATCQPLLQLGAACAAGEECDFGASCVAGACVALSEQGAHCGPGGPFCKRGLSCAAATSTCVVPPTSGPCSAGCDLRASICDNQSQACVAKLADGASCVSGLECVNLACNSSSPAATSGTCATPLTLELASCAAH
jgi:hypothetical protein